MKRPWLPWAALGLLMAAVLARLVVYVLALTNSWVQADELIYVRNAIEIGDRLRPVLADEPWFNSYAQLAQVLMAPFYRALGPVAAFDAVHVLFAAVFVSTAIPVFLLVRRLTGRPGSAVLAAALSILVPWVVFSGSVLTESVAYAVVPWSVLAMHYGLLRGGVRGDAVALAGIALAFSARTQLIVLGGAYVLAVLIHHRLRPAGLRHHALILAVAVVGLIIVATGASRTLVGHYAGAADTPIFRHQTFDAVRGMLGAATLAIGLLPLPVGVAWALGRVTRGDDLPLRAFAALLLAVGVVLSISGGAFVASFAGGINDRYIIYLAPLLVSGTVIALRDRPSPLWASTAGAALAAWALSSEYLQNTITSMVSPAQTIRRVIDGRAQQAGSLIGWDGLTVTTAAPIAALLATVIYVVLRRSPRVPAPRLAAGAGTLLLAVAVAQTAYTVNRFQGEQQGASPEFLAGRDRIDDVLDGHRAAGFIGMIYDQRSTPATWWELLFFNESVDRAYVINGAPMYSTPVPGVAILPDGKMPIGAPQDGQRRYIVMSASDARFGFQGAHVEHQLEGVTVRSVALPWRAAWFLEPAQTQIDALGANQAPGGGPASSGEGTIPVGRATVLRIYGDGRSRDRTATLSFTTSVGAPRGYRLRVGDRRPVDVNLGEIKKFRTQVKVPARGSDTIHLAVTDQLPGQTPDPAAGLRLVGVELD